MLRLNWPKLIDDILHKICAILQYSQHLIDFLAFNWDYKLKAASPAWITACS